MTCTKMHYCAALLLLESFSAASGSVQGTFLLIFFFNIILAIQRFVGDCRCNKQLPELFLAQRPPQTATMCGLMRTIAMCTASGRTTSASGTCRRWLPLSR